MRKRVVSIQVPDVAPDMAEKPFLKKVLVTKLLTVKASTFGTRIAKAVPSENISECII